MMEFIRLAKIVLFEYEWKLPMTRNLVMPLTFLLFFLGMTPAEGDRTGRRELAYSSEAEKLFTRGVSAYRKQNFQQAREQFQKLLEFPLHQRSSASQLMLGKVLFRLREYAPALEVARALEKRFADSRYVADARLLAGDCYYVLRRYAEAAMQYGRIMASPAPLLLQAQAAERLAAIVKNGSINEEGVANVRAAIGENRLRESLLFGEGRWYRRLGWEAQSQIAMQRYLDEVPEGIFSNMAAVGYEAEGGNPASIGGEDWVLPIPAGEETSGYKEGEIPRLGLLLPLSGTGFQRQVGEELYAGVQLANEQAGEPFELVVADIGIEYGNLPIDEIESSRLLRVVQQTRRLIDGEGVLAIVGPVFSSDCVAAAVVAEAAGIPLIAPLADQSGLDLLGENIFQLHAIPEVQAQALGEYATLVLGLQDLVVIAPLTDYGWNFEREFSRVAAANGGEVVHVDWYVPEVTKDFRHVFESIRQVGFSLMPPPEDTLAVVDSLEWTVDDSVQVEEEPSFLTELLAGLEGEEEITGSVEEEEEEEAPPDSSEIFIDSIDAIAIIVESFEDAERIPQQLRFHRLETQILGNDIWYEPEAIRQMRSRDRENIEGAIFVSGYQETHSATRKFIDAFRRRFARDVGYAAYGYDAASLVVNGWREGQQVAGALRGWLAAVRDFDGASGSISFVRDRRTNGELALLKIDPRGRIRPLESRDLPDLSPIEMYISDGDPDLPRADLPEEELRRDE